MPLKHPCDIAISRIPNQAIRERHLRYLESLETDIFRPVGHYGSFAERSGFSNLKTAVRTMRKVAQEVVRKAYWSRIVYRITPDFVSWEYMGNPCPARFKGVQITDKDFLCQ